MNRFILMNTTPGEVSILNMIFSQDPSFSYSVAEELEKIKHYLALWGHIDLVIMGAGNKTTQEGLAQTVNFINEVKFIWPKLNIVLVSTNQKLLEVVAQISAEKIMGSLNLSAQTGLPLDEIAQKINEYLIQSKKDAPPPGKMVGVLIVDDDSVVLYSIELLLKSAGRFRIFSAEEPEDAYKKFKDNLANLDVCLIDYNLRGQTAERLIQALNRLEPRIKIFVITGENKDQQALWPETVSKIVSGVFSKPLDVEEFKSAVNNILNLEKAEKDQGARRILIIDDSPEVAQILNTVLGENYLVFAAEDGKTGLEKFKEIKPALVILDYRLPDTNGLEVLKEIKQSRPEQKVIVVTIEKKQEVAQKFLALGALNVLNKPVGIKELKSAVKGQFE